MNLWLIVMGGQQPIKYICQKKHIQEKKNIKTFGKLKSFSYLYTIIKKQQTMKRTELLNVSAFNGCLSLFMWTALGLTTDLAFIYPALGLTLLMFVGIGLSFFAKN
jgi:hypothetical protein